WPGPCQLYNYWLWSPSKHTILMFWISRLHSITKGEQTMSNRIDRVVITGGSSGIGFDMARRFLSEGWQLLLNARDRERIERLRPRLEGGPRVVTVPGPVGEPATAKAVVAAAREQLGGIDVLVNNAGIFGVKPFLESTIEDLERFFATNVRGT